MDKLQIQLIWVYQNTKNTVIYYKWKQNPLKIFIFIISS